MRRSDQKRDYTDVPKRKRAVEGRLCFHAAIFGVASQPGYAIVTKERIAVTKAGQA